MATSPSRKNLGRLKAGVRREAYKRTANQVDAQVLAELWAWTPYAKTTRDDKVWVVKTDHDLIEQDGVAAAPRTIRDSLDRLRRRGLIETTRGPHPNGRIPNSRYVRLADGLFEELEICAQSGSKRRVSRRVDRANATVSKRDEAPGQNGGNRLFHIQRTSKEPDIGTDKKEERAASGNNEKRIHREENERNDELMEIQKRFEEGCTKIGVVAPALDHAKRVGALNRFAAACRIAKLTRSEMAQAAYLFARHYSRDRLADHLGRASKDVSPAPNHFLLGMAADLAIAYLRHGPPGSKWAHWFETDEP